MLKIRQSGSKFNRMITKFFIYFIRFYRLFLSPLIGRNCRFTPTCSEYAIKALTEFGVVHGLYLTIKRILKCNPFFKPGFDPVPEKENKSKD